MASVVTNAKTMFADDLDIQVPEPLCTSAKSKETKEVGLVLDDPSRP